MKVQELQEIGFDRISTGELHTVLDNENVRAMYNNIKNTWSFHVIDSFGSETREALGATTIEDVKQLCKLING